MREVAVTDGDKVEAQLKFGYSVNTHGVGDLVAVINKVKEKEIDDLCEVYSKEYKLVDSLKKKGSQHQSLRDAAKIEIGMRRFLRNGNYKGYTDTFEDLHGMTQLPGIPITSD
jgi:L-arabinose isomerase